MSDFSRIKTILTFAEKIPEEKLPLDSLMKSEKLMKTPKPIKGDETFEDGTFVKKA